MADKKRAVILYLSDYKPQNKEERYSAPDGKIYDGAQTNDAPMKYILSSFESVDKVICITTPEAETNDLRGRLQTEGYLKEYQNWLPVQYSVGDDFTETALPEILNLIGDEGNTELLLETTGGERSAVMKLLLVSRVLAFTGVPTIGAVYSNYYSKRIEDVTELVRMFDLVGGMQELTGFGSVRTLKKYYQGKNAAMDDLISSMGKLTDLISLCRTEKLDDAISAVNRSLAEVEKSDEQDAVTRLLLPLFREKFGTQLTVPGLIRWCIENDMLQQAMTIYVERIPREIVETRGFLKVQGGSESLRDYQDIYTQQFVVDFLMMASRNNDYKVNARSSVEQLFKRNDNQAILQDPLGHFRVDTWKTALSNLRLFIALQYEKDPAANSDPRKSEPQIRALQKLADEEDLQNPDDFVNALYQNKTLFWLLAERSRYVATVENMQSLLNPKNTYRNQWDQCFCSISITVEDMQTIARDYMYIKILRNMTNHANDSETFEQEIQMRYLEKWYTPLAEVTPETVRLTLLTALEHLDIASRRKK